jgi:hypothetical protein
MPPCLPAPPSGTKGLIVLDASAGFCSLGFLNRGRISVEAPYAVGKRSALFVEVGTGKSLGRLCKT